uniref:Uncharacterized protein n=1 Tax=Strix occidentalis caurina TaxID=311401 RepID=A0A8D0FY57_STROC
MAAAARDPLSAPGLDEADEAVRGTCEDASVCKRTPENKLQNTVRVPRGEGGPLASALPKTRLLLLLNTCPIFILEFVYKAVYGDR